MFDWFEKTAPIRVKFKALLAIHGSLAAVSLVSVWFAMAGGGYAALAVAALSFVLTILTVVISGRLICTPYVNTVVRMEALARGDTTSTIDYTDYRDCVGRMTKAMAVFRDNAEEVAAAAAQQQQVVDGLATGLSRLEAGDLTHLIATPFAGDYDKLRLSYNQAVQGLDEILGKVTHSASSVHAGSTEIRGASEDLARRTETQAASLEETAAAMGQVTAMVSNGARAAADIRQAMSRTRDDASSSGDVVGKAVSAMAEIENSSQEIGSIINVIDGIAFQTNLLALNAGVEAARAGDAGKGFAVVANEVRALAQRSADAAKEIKDLINTSTGQVNQGVALVAETGKMLERIASRIGEVNGLVEGMASDAEKQAANVQQVNATIGDMDRMTQQNAAMVEETMAASRSLSGEADQLAALVTRFALTRGPGTGGARGRNEGRASRPAPVLVSGNLALQAEPDWSEF